MSLKSESEGKLVEAGEEVKVEVKKVGGGKRESEEGLGDQLGRRSDQAQVLESQELQLRRRVFREDQQRSMVDQMSLHDQKEWVVKKGKEEEEEEEEEEKKEEKGKIKKWRWSEINIGDTSHHQEEPSFLAILRFY